MAIQKDSNCSLNELNELNINCIKSIHFEYDSHIIISTLGMVISIIGIIGHFFSIIVLCKKKFKKLSSYAYLLALSICNEISLILTVITFLDDLLPFAELEKKNIVIFYKILRIYIEPITVSSQALSIWICMSFTIDRYIYCCQPYYSGKYCTRKRASIIIILLYILASLYSIPQFFERSYEIEKVIDVPFVVPVFTSIGKNYYFRSIFQIFIYSAFVVLIPFTIILILNVFLIYDIIKSNKRHRKLSLAFKVNNENDCNNKKNTGNNKIKSVLCSKKNTKANTDSNNETDHLNGSIDINQQLSSNNTTNNIIKAKKHSIISNKSIFNIAEKTMRNDVTIMLIGLIVVFFICLTPSTILRLITYKRQNIIFEKLYTLFLDISNLLVVCNSTLNCIMYVMLGKKFREQFIKSFCPKIYKKKLKNYHSTLFTSYKNENKHYHNNNNHNTSLTNNDINLTL